MANKAITFFKGLYHDVVAVVKGHGIEAHGDAHLNALQRFLHFWILTWRGFLENRCPSRATALAYTTLLALIPLLAVAASIWTGLLKSQGEKPVEVMIEKLVQNVAPQLDLVPKEGDEESGRRKVVKTITDSIKGIDTGKLGVTGVVALVVVAIMLLITIEATFNDIWGVTVGRTWLTRIIQYWATVTLGPLIPVLAMALNTSTHFGKAQGFIAELPLVGYAVVKLVPFVVLSLAFSLLYQLMPNTRVRWKAALVGGFVGGSLWQVNSMLSIIYAARVTSYVNLYGPLSLIPVFLIGIYFSWMILLFGAQVAYTFQNRKVYLQQKQAENINEVGRELLALRMMTLIGQQFSEGKPPLTLIDMGEHVNVPTRLAGEVLQSLIEAGLLVEVEGAETAFTVACPLEKITTDDMIGAVREGTGRRPETREDATGQAVENAFEQIREAEKGVSSKMTLATLVEQVQAAADTTAGRGKRRGQGTG